MHSYCAEKLNELKTDDVKPLTSIAETTLKFRSDEIKSKNIREQIIKNSPEDNEDYFEVFTRIVLPLKDFPYSDVSSTPSNLFGVVRPLLVSSFLDSLLGCLLGNRITFPMM